ncbi:hypothetical protein COT97_03055 [Candidatus Falkowbacteria bacterium CG10_big_fil_rev_8_21_14_0_10_39_11]|uniref:Peptidase M20 dimerisation domain-containing protein n=1 Tax=Candidatus Falkowbacteria bacterium CG10_big_fil_rev_8_21_14_0_10_39_11 TaxID=1974565 RepID=A0A2H0V4W1_9BACT|nr:MAG: hypothetical protein COT97_03055 [Candidatus Falkowbacteria bacterium CG10_big_fil_rev_8_21_14_0_10_39_11]
MNTKELLSKLISFDSQCTKSNKDIAMFIASLFPKDLVTVGKFKSKQGLDLYNVAVKISGENSNLPPLIFSGHTDTVPISGNWETDPFVAAEEAGMIIGLGAVDMKGGVAALIKTALDLIDNQPQRDCYFLFDADEEGDGYGGQRFINQYQFKNADIVIAEPTDKKIIIGQKGVMELKITFNGKEQHVSRADQFYNEKYNAIYKAVKAINEIKIIERQLNAIENKRFSPPTLTVCQINGGTGVNIIPSKTEMVVSCRFLPTQDFLAVKQQIINQMKNIDPQVAVDELLIGEANLVNSDNQLVIACSRVSRVVIGQASMDVFTGWTQAGVYKQWGNCLIWGPGGLKLAHTAGEYVSVADIEIMEKCYQSLAKNG